MKLPDGVYIRCGSHRAHDKVARALGRKLRQFWSFYELHICLIQPHEWPLVQNIKGVTRAKIKHPDKMSECWYLDGRIKETVAKAGPRGTPAWTAVIHPGNG